MTNKQNQTILITILLFTASLITAGVLTTQYLQQPPESQLYQEEFNTVADQQNNTQEIQFDGDREIGIWLDFNAEEPRFYLDLTGDGSYATEFENITRDGQQYTFSRETVQQDKVYQIIFTYKASEEETWLRLDRIQEI